ncbi:dTDP-4-dehydrorhamnose 3,5-epimerase [Marinicauda pacifica]|uniref:dTDP-4-dehydrorhamnose 3,5-epimerase n=1 Tax=Marinicauda pacifica TaxID=1133559 RepID=A0A4S2H8C9_9PROT|nr:dTDP-4-dehydrorhamnose 3,5-epimerase [Marinicauda pacifica]TGY92087.1 dTDP-4-dehydrorhamnose 3,5-epimerase [Marinicauda pacifica]GGE45898.1 dTDP-4-dehydrorhamnose 3,5-epimerase [Marinicauda pacifica]
MNVTDLELPGVKIIEPRRFGDDRGWFSETYNQKALAAAGVDLEFVQDNHSYSRDAGTLRGLHYQAPPFAQDKLVRVVRGSVLDVAVDARKGSASYGRWVSATLSAENGKQILVPAGFLHGFLTLEPHTEVVYKVTSFYSAECDGSVLWNDADLAIDWGELDGEPVLSGKDKDAVTWAEFDSPFSV